MIQIPAKYIEVTERAEIEVKNYLYDVWVKLMKNGNPVSGNINGVSIVMFLTILESDFLIGG